MTEFDLFIKRLIKGAYNIIFREVIRSSSGFNIIKADGVYLEAIKKIKESLSL